MSNALTKGGGAGRKASPPVKKKTQALASKHDDASAVQTADTLHGAGNDVQREARGPNWLRSKYPPKRAGGGEPVTHKVGG